MLLGLYQPLSWVTAAKIRFQIYKMAQAQQVATRPLLSVLICITLPFPPFTVNESFPLLLSQASPTT